VQNHKIGTRALKIESLESKTKGKDLIVRIYELREDGYVKLDNRGVFLQIAG
jgi:hypothetical protein